jgi:hypothetical protein
MGQIINITNYHIYPMHVYIGYICFQYTTKAGQQAQHAVAPVVEVVL